MRPFYLPMTSKNFIVTSKNTKPHFPVIKRRSFTHPMKSNQQYRRKELTKTILVSHNPLLKVLQQNTPISTLLIRLLQENYISASSRSAHPVRSGFNGPVQTCRPMPAMKWPYTQPRYFPAALSAALSNSCPCWNWLEDKSTGQVIYRNTFNWTIPIPCSLHYHPHRHRARTMRTRGIASGEMYNKLLCSIKHIVNLKT